MSRIKIPIDEHAEEEVNKAIQELAPSMTDFHFL
jgi:hypothetical protein